MDKAPEAYRTISEVADDLDLPQHVLRFWETRFSQIRPLKRGGGRRYYRPEDIDLLRGIRHLLYGEGYTIRGVQRIIKESGVKAIQALGRGEGAAPLPKPAGPEIIDPGLAQDREDEVPVPPLAGDEARIAPFDAQGYGRAPFAAAGTVEEGERPGPDAPAHHAAVDEADPAPAGRLLPQPVFAPQPAAPAAPPALHAPQRASAAQPAAGQVPAVDMPSQRPPAEPRAFAPSPPPARLPAEDVRRLQAALYELLECRKKLDEVFAAR